MKQYICILLLFFAGCGLDYPGYSNYSSSSGFSSYLKKTTGTSNLVTGYKDPPIIDDPNDAFQNDIFKSSAEEYLEAVVSDLEEVEKNADNAEEKIQAVADAANFGFEFFHVRHVGAVIHMSRESNFGLLGYPDFPDFNYFFPPTKPYKPLFLDSQFAVDSYNASVRRYNREVADFTATIIDYIDDAKHYIHNCRNDYNVIRQKGLKFLSYIKSLDVNQTLHDYPTDSLSWEATETNKPIKIVETNKATVKEIFVGMSKTDFIKVMGNSYQYKTDVNGEFLTYMVNGKPKIYFFKDGVYCKPIFEIEEESSGPIIKLNEDFSVPIIELKEDSSVPIIKLTEEGVLHLK